MRNGIDLSNNLTTGKLKKYFKAAKNDTVKITLAGPEINKYTIPLVYSSHLN